MRKKSRELALLMLFQNEFAPQISMPQLIEVFGEAVDRETSSYGEVLIRGVLQHLEDIDSKIQSYSKNWKLDRMSKIDKNVMRIATFEMLYAPEVLRPNIAINEAIDLAKKYGSQDSGSFVNGLLDQISKNT